MKLAQGQFLNPFRGEQVDDDEWKLLGPLSYIDSYSVKHDVPIGFITDFASVPWPLSMIWKKSGWYNRGAVVHDKMYRSSQQSRYTCDWVLLDAMLSIIVADVRNRALRSPILILWRVFTSAGFFMALRLLGRRKRLKASQRVSERRVGAA